MKKEKTINIEVSEDEFFAFQLFKKSVDRAAVVYKYQCGYNNEYISILSNDEVHAKLKKVMDEQDKLHNSTINYYMNALDESKSEIKKLKEQLDILKYRPSNCSTLEVKEEKKKPWFQFTIG